MVDLLDFPRAAVGNLSQPNEAGFWYLGRLLWLFTMVQFACISDVFRREHLWENTARERSRERNGFVKNLLRLHRLSRFELSNEGTITSYEEITTHRTKEFPFRKEREKKRRETSYRGLRLVSIATTLPFLEVRNHQMKTLVTCSKRSRQEEVLLFSLKKREKHRSRESAAL